MEQYAEWTVVALAVFVAVSVLLLMLGLRKRKWRLINRSSKQYCEINKVEELHNYSDGGVVTLKRIYVLTPLGIGAIFDIPAAIEPREGDSVMIEYDPSNASFFRLAGDPNDPKIKRAGEGP